MVKQQEQFSFSLNNSMLTAGIQNAERLLFYRFDSSSDAMAALSNLRAFSDGGIDTVDVSAFRGGYIFEVSRGCYNIAYFPILS